MSLVAFWNFAKRPGSGGCGNGGPQQLGRIHRSSDQQPPGGWILYTRWFFVTFSSPSWRSLNHLKGSLNHPISSNRFGWVGFVRVGDGHFLTEIPICPSALTTCRFNKSLEVSPPAFIVVSSWCFMVHYIIWTRWVLHIREGSVATPRQQKVRWGGSYNDNW